MSEILNIHLAIEQAGGNADLAKDLFRMLLNELPDQMNKLIQAYDNNDKEALWNMTHKIYGATAYCGVPALCNAAKQLEDAIKSDSGDLQEKTECINIAITDLIEVGPDFLEQVWSK